MLKTNLWTRLEPLLARVERPARYLNREWGCVYKRDADLSFCMVYPDTYELGQANQAVRILVNAVNATERLMAERAFLPAVDLIDLMRVEGLPLFSIESCAPLSEFDVIGITLPHELAATNVLEAIDLAGLPLRAAERAEDDPDRCSAAGLAPTTPSLTRRFSTPCWWARASRPSRGARAHPRDARAQGLPCGDPARFGRCARHLRAESVPLARQGGGAEGRQLDRARLGGRPDAHREARLHRLRAKRRMGAYGGSLHRGRARPPQRRGAARMRARLPLLPSGHDVSPVRERSADNIVDAVVRGLDETGYDEVSLTSLSSTDHSQIAEILTRVNAACDGRGIRVSVPSQRLDSFGVEMAGLVAGQKKGGLTFAPEAGTQRLRDVINKNVTEDDLFSAIDAAFQAGWRRCKLYFMIGLPPRPTRTSKGIASLAQRAYDRAKANVPADQRGSVRMSVSCAVFVPKAQTPFQWDGQISPEETMRRVGLLKRSVKYKAVDVRYHDPKTSFVEAVMSRGGREVADLVECAWRAGARFDAWTELFSEQAWRRAIDEVGIDPEAIAQASFDTDYVMPWSHISAGVSERFLALERRRAQEEKTTPDCTFGRCTGCGACQAVGVDNELAKPASQAGPTP